MYYSHGDGTVCPSHNIQFEEQSPRPVRWAMCFLLVTSGLVQILTTIVQLYIIRICISNRMECDLYLYV